MFARAQLWLARVHLLMKQPSLAMQCAALGAAIVKNETLIGKYIRAEAYEMIGNTGKKNYRKKKKKKNETEINKEKKWSKRKNQSFFHYFFLFHRNE